MTLTDFGFDLSADHEEKYRFVISAASGEIAFDGIRAWITDHLSEL